MDGLKIFVILCCVVTAVLLSLICGKTIFENCIDSTYSQYNLVSEGKLEMWTDCVGYRVFSIGGFNIPLNKLTASRFKKEDARSFLNGGDCEYKVYKGWVWGIGDFYYITPK
jgi:hypothetical protein